MIRSSNQDRFSTTGRCFRMPKPFVSMHRWLPVAVTVTGLFWLSCEPKLSLDPTAPAIQEIPIFSVMTAFPNQITAGGSESTIMIRLVDERGNRLAQKTVSFKTTLGTLVAVQQTTDDSGSAVTVLRSTTVTGTATVTAEYGSFAKKSIAVQIMSTVDSTVTQMNVASDQDAILANGIETATITVTMVPGTGQSVAGRTVLFNTTLGTITQTAVVAQSNQAKAVLTSPASIVDLQSVVTVSFANMSKTLPILFKGIQMAVEANPSTIYADGKNTSTVHVQLKERTTQVGISDADVLFGASIGSIEASKKTDARGVAEAKLTGTKSGVAMVVVRYGKTFLDTVTVELISVSDTTKTRMDLAVAKQELLANGVDKTEISVTLIPGSGQTIIGQNVSFTTTSGTISPTATIGPSNQATVQLTSSALTNNVTVTVTASYRDVIKTATVLFKGIQFSAEASPTAIIADGKAQSTISVQLKETSTQIGISGAEILFGATLGSINALQTTDSRGIATALFTGTKTGLSTIIVRYGKTFLDTVHVQLMESLPVNLDVSATPSVLPADGYSQSVIKAIVTDFNRNPVPDGTVVQFRLVEGNGSIIQQKTTIGGIAESAYTAGTRPDTATITISVGTLSATVTVYSKIGDPDQVLMSSNTSKLAADGISNAQIQVRVLDSQGNPIQGITVRFTASIGDVTPSAPTDAQGIALAQYSSSLVGNATITASVQKANGLLVTGILPMQLLPGGPQSIVLSFNPTDMGVKDTGQNQTAEVTAEVKDSKNNAVEDGTLVRFSIYASPGGGENLSTTLPVPTVGGTAKVSLSSGTRSGSVRIRAEVLDKQGNSLNPAVIGISSKLIIHAGPACIENVNDLATTHLTVAATRHNICASLVDTTKVTVYVGDKYDNPVEQTSVYLTTAGGIITTSPSLTNENGIAQFMLFAAMPQPSIDRYYNSYGMQDPNLGTIVSLGSIPDFEGGHVYNLRGDTGENEGVTRVVAYANGQDASGKSARAWHWTRVVHSVGIVEFSENSLAVAQLTGDTLHFQGQSKTILIRIWDSNGNPISSGSALYAAVKPGAVQAELSWTQLVTGADEGTCYYPLTISNAIDPENPKPGWVQISISLSTKNPISYSITHPLVTGASFYVEGP